MPFEKALVSSLATTTFSGAFPSDAAVFFVAIVPHLPLIALSRNVVFTVPVANQESFTCTRHVFAVELSFQRNIRDCNECMAHPS